MAGQGASAARRMKGKVKEAIARMRPFQAEAISVSDGVVTIQEPGSEEEPFLQGVPALRGAQIAEGDTALILPIGDGDTWVALGAVDADGIARPRIGQTFVLPTSASAATVGSNTSNSTYVTLRAQTWTDDEIPDGRYTLQVVWEATFSDSASGTLNGRVSVGATVDTVTSLSLTTAREPVRYIRTFTDVAVVAGLTVTVEYKRDSGTGTLSARNPMILVLATRTGDL